MTGAPPALAHQAAFLYARDAARCFARRPRAARRPLVSGGMRATVVLLDVANYGRRAAASQHGATACSQSSLAMHAGRSSHSSSSSSTRRQQLQTCKMQPPSLPAAVHAAVCLRHRPSPSSPNAGPPNRVRACVASAALQMRATCSTHYCSSVACLASGPRWPCCPLCRCETPPR